MHRVIVNLEIVRGVAEEKNKFREALKNCL